MCMFRYIKVSSNDPFVVKCLCLQGDEKKLGLGAFFKLVISRGSVSTVEIKGFSADFLAQIE